MTVLSERVDTHIMFVSEHNSPNLWPATDSKLTPSHAILVTTPEMKARAESLERALRMTVPGVAIEYVDVPNGYDILMLADTLEALIRGLRDRGLRPLFNLTCGTKAMTLAAMTATETTKIPCLYLPIDSHEMIFVRELETMKLDCAMQLKPYVSLYGFAMREEQKSLPFSQELRDLAEELARTDSFREVYPAVNRLASEATEKLAVSLDAIGPTSAAFDALLDRFEEVQLLTINGRTVRFGNEAKRFFVNGGWLEDWAANAARRAFPGTKVVENARIDYIEGQNGKVDVKGMHNELDVVFWQNDRLVILECKTSDLGEEKRFNDVIYKLSALGKLFGKTVRPVIVSYLPLPDAALNRAKSLRIEVVAGKDVWRLEERLKGLLREKVRA